MATPGSVSPSGPAVPRVPRADRAVGARQRAGQRDSGGRRRDAGPGIIETSLVLGLAAVLTLIILAGFGGPLADVIGVIVDAAHGGR